MTPCRICGAPVTRNFCDLGESPLANSFLLPTEEAMRAEKQFPLRARVCGVCLLVQVEPFEPPERIFNDYAYYSSFSSSLLEHSKRYVDRIVSRLHLDGDSLVVEVASNDGYLLQYFVERGIPVVGVEPAENIAAAARERGVPTETRFFGAETARDLLKKYRAADVLVANNVIAHVPDLHDFLVGMATILGPDATATIEFPHLLRLVEDGLFDTIYHEHFSYFSLHSLERALASHGLAVVDLEELPTHGGSLRLFVQHAAAGNASPRVSEFRNREVAHGLLDLRTYDAFQRVAESKRDDVLGFFASLRSEGRHIAGYGAPAKANTLFNFCGLTVRDVPYTVDKNPFKQGHLLPGSHIPIAAPHRLHEERPDTIVILPWNLRGEIAAEIAFAREWGGRYAVLAPRIELS